MADAPPMNVRLLGRSIGPAVYCGRFPDDLHHDLVLDDRQVVASRSIRLLADCSALVILDGLSFPWEMLDQIVEALPFYLVLPSRMTAQDVRTVFATALSAVTFCDRVIVADETIGSALADEHRWARCQWQVHDGALPDIARSLLADLLARESVPVEWGTDPRREGLPCREDGNAAVAVPERAVSSARRSLRDQKHMHVRQCAAITRALRGNVQQPPGWVALEIGCGIGRWVSEFERHGAEYVGLDKRADAAGACRANHAAASVFVGDARQSLPIRDNSVELVALMGVLRQLAGEEKRAAMQNAWRVLRPGGLMLLLESFVGAVGPGSSADHASWRAMQEMIVEETRNTALLEHFETVSYRTGVEAALAMFSKLGDPSS